jgi:hypothetical protein
MPDDRPKNRQVENENARPESDGQGQPPRPATEPDGAKSSSQSPKLHTDPGSGESNEHAKPKTEAPPGWP